MDKFLDFMIWNLVRLLLVLGVLYFAVGTIEHTMANAFRDILQVP